MSSREQKKQQTRQAFYDAILNLCMMGQSFSSISLRQVTREVGVVPTAFYRHFDDMEALGTDLVENKLGEAIEVMRDYMQFGRQRTFERQIATSVEIFFSAIDAQPTYWHFIASERFGGSESVRNAINNQTELFARILSNDLGLQPAFAHINEYDRYLLAKTGINLSFSWIVDWLDTHDVAKYDQNTDIEIIKDKQQKMLHNCTRQMQMLFYGAHNWQSSEKTLLKND